MTVLRSSPTVFQSIQSAFRSATSGGSILLGAFNDPVKSKMHAIPAHTGLRELRLTSVLPWQPSVVSANGSSIQPSVNPSIAQLKYHKTALDNPLQQRAILFFENRCTRQPIQTK